MTVKRRAEHNLTMDHGHQGQTTEFYTTPVVTAQVNLLMQLLTMLPHKVQTNAIFHTTRLRGDVVAGSICCSSMGLFSSGELLHLIYVLVLHVICPCSILCGFRRNPYTPPTTAQGMAPILFLFPYVVQNGILHSGY